MRTTSLSLTRVARILWYLTSGLTLAASAIVPALSNPNTANTASSAVTSVLQGVNTTQPGGLMYFFETSEVPASVSAAQGKLAISNLFAKDGTNSLSWDYVAGDVLTFTLPQVTTIKVDPVKPRTFMLWVYAPQAQAATSTYTFNFKYQGKVVKSFKVAANFAGWRGITVPYQDMVNGNGFDAAVDKEVASATTATSNGKIEQFKIDAFEIIAPAVSKNTPSGQVSRLYIDQLLLQPGVDNRWPTPDSQLPKVNVGVKEQINKNWNGLHYYAELLASKIKLLDPTASTEPVVASAQTYRNLDSAEVEKIFADESIQDILQRIDIFNGLEPGKIPALTDEQFAALEDEYASFGIKYIDLQQAYAGLELGKIVEAQQVVTTGSPVSAFPVGGKTLTYPTYLDHLKDPINTTTQVRDELLANTNDLRKIGQWTLKVAKALRAYNLSSEQRGMLEDRLVSVVQYVISQGFYAGSNYQIVHHLGYQTREYFTGMFLARDVLAKYGLLDITQKTIAWYSGTGRIYEPINDANADIFNTQLLWMLQSLLLIDKPAIRTALLEQFSSWLSASILVSNNLSGGFKPDNSIFHHGQHYVAYGIDSLRGLAPTVYQLAGSKYALSRAAAQKFHDVLVNLDFTNKGINIPIAYAGRHPNSNYRIQPVAYKWAALAGSPDKSQVVDPTLAGIYARLEGMVSFAGNRALPEMVGLEAFPYSTSLVARQTDKLAQAFYCSKADPVTGAACPEQPSAGQQISESYLFIARGYSRYFPGNEAYAANNLYSRYNLNGRLEYIPGDFSKRSFNPVGYDWNHYDGTTAIVLPYEQLKAKLIQLPSAGVEEMLLSDQTFAGAIAQDNKGVFAQIVHGHAKYQQQDFWAYKSAFVFGNKVIALGSNIRATDTQNPVHTTLLQQYMYDPQALVTLVSDQAQAITMDSVLSTTQEARVVSPSGQVFFIPAGQKLVVKHTQQQSVDDRNSKPTENPFTLVYLDHGKAPQGANYEYSMLLAPENLEAYTQAQELKAPSYQVVANTNNAQAVYDPETATLGLALYAPTVLSNKAELTTQALAPVGLVGANTPSMLIISRQAPEQLQARLGAAKVGNLTYLQAFANEQGNNPLYLSVYDPDLRFYAGVEADQIKYGLQQEVSVYSRKWFLGLNTKVPATTLTYDFVGNYQAGDVSTCSSEPQYCSLSTKVTEDTGQKITQVTIVIKQPKLGKTVDFSLVPRK
ncbi:chondroitinase family polysaccharide lyase [Psittacicella hinzii]|uniref:Chondroitin sulfate ABC lyase n=1 Tax=Psittacicella hinzii TaxID=2028575 RepID=A0A3A1YU62_9GAMM|nr:chondroitinase family polysaccharide lyase [Psittacicella hinzii]RIY40799.1 hypothetical protein CKF58_00125 [Psittacicella hinzii]